MRNELAVQRNMIAMKHADEFVSLRAISYQEAAARDSGIVKQKQMLIAADTALQLYEERMHISKSRWDLGAGSKMEYLQAKVDMNAQKTMRLQQRNKLESLKIDLNELLSRPSLTVFDVVDSLQVNYHPSLDDMKTEAMQKNTSILLGASQQRSMALILKEVSAARYPRVNWNAGYNYNNTDNQAGFILQNRNLGWSTGLTASWTIYNGHQVSRQIEGSKIRLQQSQYTLDKTTQQVDAAVVKAYVFFTNALAVLNQEQENQALAAEVIQVSMERYRLGNASNLELKDAQRSFEEAQSRLVSARYDAKLAETELLRLNGMLVK
jgi:outer membrane protein TolC